MTGVARSLEDRRAAFRGLHESGCFLLANPWDAGSARLLQHLGFSALASSSAAFAWSIGKPDYAVTLDELLAHLTELCGAVDLPVNADFESGFAREPEAVAGNVRLAVATGVAGLSIEDSKLEDHGELYDRALSVERIRAARAELDRGGSGVVLVARTEGLLHDPSAVSDAIDRLVAFAEAGADCLYAPGVRDREDVAALVRAVAPKPVNVLALRPGLAFSELAELGVRRVSVGGSLARVAWRAVLTAASGLHSGSLDALAGGAASTELNRIFAAGAALDPARGTVRG